MKSFKNNKVSPMIEKPRDFDNEELVQQAKDYIKSQKSFVSTSTQTNLSLQHLREADNEDKAATSSSSGKNQSEWWHWPSDRN